MTPGDGIDRDHADWADARIVLQDGTSLWLDALPRTDRAAAALSVLVHLWRPPQRRCDAGLVGSSAASESLDADRTRTTTTWTDPRTGLQVEWQVTRFADFPAVDWVLWLSNTGSADTPVIENLQALDLSLRDPLPGEHPASCCTAPTVAAMDPNHQGMWDVEMGPGAVETMAGYFPATATAATSPTSASIPAARP